MLRIGVIVGSTRPARFADQVTPWVLQGVAARKDIQAEELDLREFDLPFIREPAPPTSTGGVFSDPHAREWCRRLAPCDAFIAVTPEYNHGPSAVLKNAFDSALLEWRRKPIAFVGYGGVGAARAIETLRGVVVELQMAPVRSEVNIGGDAFIGALQGQRTIDDFTYLAHGRDVLLNDLVWWANALKVARETGSQ